MIKKFLKNDYVFSVMQKSINILTSVVTVSLINRYLGTELKGEYTYIVNIATILAVVLGFGFYESYPYAKRQNKESQLKNYLNVFFLQFIIYIIIGISMGFVIKSKDIIIISILIPIQVLVSQMQMVGIVEFIRYRQILQIVVYFIDMILTILVYIFIPKSMNILLYILIIKDLIYILSYLIKCRYIPNPFKVEKKFIIFLFKFGLVAMMTKLLIELNYRIDVLLLKPFVSYSEIGLYSVGAKLAQYVWLIPDAFKEVIYSRTAKNDSVEEIKFVLKINMVITMTIIAGIIVFGKFIINVLYGAEYLDSYVVTCIIFAGIPSMVLYKLISPLYMARGKQVKCFLILFSSVISNVILSFILIPIYGKIGAATAVVVAYSVCGLIFFISFLKEYKLKWNEAIIINKNDISKLMKYLKR